MNNKKIIIFKMQEYQKLKKRKGKKSHKIIRKVTSENFTTICKKGAAQLQEASSLPKMCLKRTTPKHIVIWQNSNIEKTF